VEIVLMHNNTEGFILESDAAFSSVNFGLFPVFGSF
jgi:hypothetical protein